ncbi:MAG: hypothetical protein LBL71_02545 [Endomicrobium sp.]|nr:hypothetical protein [Endomicrobium sp.]
MKKLTVLMLVLGLAVPVQACHLFPVREKIVTVKETNYAVTAATFVVTLIASLVAGKLIFGYNKYSEEEYRKAKLTSYLQGCTVTEIRINEDVRRHHFVFRPNGLSNGLYVLNIVNSDGSIDILKPAVLDEVYNFVRGRQPELRPDPNRLIEERDRLQEQYDELKKRYDRLAGNSETNASDNDSD